MKKAKKKKPVDVARARLMRAALAASNVKFACEYALECMTLRKWAKEPELTVALDEEIKAVLSIVSKSRNLDGRQVNELSALGADILKGLNPKYTLLSRVTSWKIPGLLS